MARSTNDSHTRWIGHGVQRVLDDLLCAEGCPSPLCAHHSGGPSGGDPGDLDRLLDVFDVNETLLDLEIFGHGRAISASQWQARGIADRIQPLRTFTVRRVPIQSSGRAANSRLTCRYQDIPEIGRFHLPFIAFSALSWVSSPPATIS